uniref:Glycosyltransferase 8 domain-containing protein 1 n=1 Tax=Erpetoichthys calabaricus TaxID=27687 RepID=A0A8C4SNW9_ERPCA
MSFRRVNIVILLLIAVAFLIIVHRNLLSLNDFLKRQISDVDQNGLQPIDFIVNIPEKFRAVRTGEEMPVVLTAVEERLGGLIAAVNSIHSNTQANVVFYFVTTNDTVMHLKQWITQTELKDVKYRIVPFDPHVLAGKIKINSEQSEDIKPLTFARFFLPAFVPDGEKAIYMDDDVIVQGDIQELYNTKLKAGHAAAFSDDCDSASSKGMVRGAGNQFNYIGFLDFKKDTIKKLGMKANTCSFNPGLFVANLTEWRLQNITEQLEKWMERNVAEDLYSRTLAGSVTVPPLLIVFYKKHSTIDPLWHVRHLGSSSAGNRYSSQFIKAAKLLHWNGHFKPWGRASPYSDTWDSWYIPDPTGKFHPIRRSTEEK